MYRFPLSQKYWPYDFVRSTAFQNSKWILGSTLVIWQPHVCYSGSLYTSLLRTTLHLRKKQYLDQHSPPFSNCGKKCEISASCFALEMKEFLIVYNFTQAQFWKLCCPVLRGFSQPLRRVKWCNCFPGLVSIRVPVSSHAEVLFRAVGVLLYHNARNWNILQHEVWNEWSGTRKKLHRFLMMLAHNCTRNKGFLYNNSFRNTTNCHLEVVY